MNSNEFLELMKIKTDSQLVDLCLFDDAVPYVFDPNPDSWNKFRNEITSQLGVQNGDIRVVGSGRFGFSMKPWMKLAQFTDTSDIDVVIVNTDAFDELWISLLKAAYPRGQANVKLGGWLKERKNEVYTGWITPLGIHIDTRIFGTKANQVREFRSRWFSALKTSSKHPPRRHEDVTGRLYRTWQHAELYHLDSLAALRKSLTQEGFRS